VRTLGIFRDRPVFSHVIQKVSGRAFHWCGWILVISKNNWNTHNPVLVSYPKQEHIPRNGGYVFTVFVETVPRATLNLPKMFRPSPLVWNLSYIRYLVLSATAPLGSHHLLLCGIVTAANIAVSGWHPQTPNFKTANAVPTSIHKRQ